MVYEYIREINFSRYRYRYLTYFNFFKNLLRLVIVFNPIMLCIIEKTTMYSCDHGYRNSLPGLVVRDIQWVREWLVVGEYLLVVQTAAQPGGLMTQRWGKRLASDVLFM